jgi:hypothetical protein
VTRLVRKSVFEAVIAHFKPIPAARALLLIILVSREQFPATGDAALHNFFRLAFLVAKIVGCAI